jgi:hypothetical protein
MASYAYTFTSGDTVTPTKLNNARTVSDIVNADIKSDAAIAFSKLAALDSANILVGNGSNVATKVAVTGDVTISNAGVTAIGSSKVVTAMVNDAAITPAKLSQPLTLATAQNTTSGTSIDFTGIPSWVKRITVSLAGVSTNGSSNLLLRLGTSSGFTTTGYTSSAAVISSAPAYANSFSSAGLVLGGMTATSVVEGVFSIVNHNGNVWLLSGTTSRTDGVVFLTGYVCGGHTLASALDRIRLTTVNGTDTFDAGSVNIMYEG